MLIGHGMFGIGGFIGPLIVYLFEEYSYLFMGFFILGVSPCYYFLKTPEDQKKVIKKVK